MKRLQQSKTDNVIKVNFSLTYCTANTDVDEKQRYHLFNVYRPAIMRRRTC